MLSMLVMAGQATAGPASDVIAAAPSIEAECAYLLRECQLWREARDAHPGWVEHPSGVVFSAMPPEMSRHMQNAVEAAAAMRRKHGSRPACVEECSDVLRRWGLR